MFVFPRSEQTRRIQKSQPSHIERRPDLPHIVAAVSGRRGEAWEDCGQLRGDWRRAMALMAARRWAGIDNRTLAEGMGGKDDSAVTQAVKRLEAQDAGDSEID
jgi:hypothetical protein